jgi:putative ABC transport system permease protein
MKTRDLVSLSILSLKRGGTRSLLSILGIVIGIASVILILSITEAGKDFIVSQVQSTGSDLIFIENGSPSQITETPDAFTKQVLTEQDLKSLKKQTWVASIAPIVISSDSVNVLGQIANATVVGSNAVIQEVFSVDVEKGAFFTDDDVSSHRRAIILGGSIAKKLFGFEDPVNRTIDLGGQKLRVAGVMEAAGTRFMMNIDDYVYIPYTTSMDLYAQTRFMEFILKPTIPRYEATERVKAILRDNHNIDNPDDDDFRVMTQEDVVKIVDQVTGSLSIFLGAVAGISLVVGGIGIMNIMFVSVTERTREIGLRKSLGARTGVIMRQFLIEAAFLTSIGGIIGTLLGIALTWLAIQIILQYQPGWHFTLSVTGVALGVGFSTAVGLVFGYAPAKKAASINPIEALRYE